MAASNAVPLFSLLSVNPLSTMDCYESKLTEPMFFLLLFFTLSLLCVCALVFSIRRRLKKTERQSSNLIIQRPLSKFVGRTKHTYESNLTHSLLLEILPSKWATLVSGEVCDKPVTKRLDLDRESVDSGGEDCVKKKRKKKRAKKKPNSTVSTAEEKSSGKEGSRAKERKELVCLYPFTSPSSVTQRKIKQQYDQLVKSHESSGLTLAQVGQFVDCLIETRNELQHKSEVIQRKFTITKALLLKADRSSFDRLRQQIYKLELEQKRLEEDAFVYNWLQQQLKLSPAYKKMIEIGACLESESKSSDLTESTDAEFAEISFEELLAQEKKDSFWQRNGKPRSWSN